MKDITEIRSEIDKIDDQIKLLGVAVSAQNANEVKKSKTLLINYIEQIKEHEMLTLDNIL